MRIINVKVWFFAYYRATLRVLACSNLFVGIMCAFPSIRNLFLLFLRTLAFSDYRVINRDKNHDMFFV